MKPIPFNEQIYNFIAKKGKGGATVKEVIEAFPDHTSSSISGVLHGLKKEGRIKHISRGKYAVLTGQQSLTKNTSLKKAAIRDLIALRDSYEFNVSDPMTYEQLREAKEIFDLLNDLIEKLQHS